MAIKIIDNMSDFSTVIYLINEAKEMYGEYPAELFMLPVSRYPIDGANYGSPINSIDLKLVKDVYHGSNKVKPLCIKYLRFLPKLTFDLKKPDSLLISLKLTNSVTITTTLLSTKEYPDQCKVPNIESRISSTSWKWYQYNLQHVSTVRIYIEQQIELNKLHDFETIKGEFLAKIINSKKPVKVLSKNGLTVSTYSVVNEIVSDTKVDIGKLGVVLKKETTWFNKQMKKETEYMIVSALGAVMVFEGENPDFVTPSKLVYIRLV